MTDVSSYEDYSAINVGLVSGGEDSTTAAAVAHEDVGLDMLVYLDTGTGMDENRSYIETLADHLGLQLWTLRTGESFEERVKEHFFPGPSRHNIMYRTLKERQLEKLATVVNSRGTAANLHLWTGVRSSESQRRMKRVDPEQEAARWVWHAPIHDWSKEDCREYIDNNDLPRNPVWDSINRSGDCFCGCFGNPEEKLDLMAAGYDEQVKWIESLELELHDERDDCDHKCSWAWGALDDEERERAAENEMDEDMLLCSGCGYTKGEGGDEA